MNWYIMAFQRFADFSGRSRRKEYWIFALINLLISIGLGIVDAMLGMAVLGSIYGLVILIPAVSLSVRRLHDIGMKGWWLLVLLVPFLNLLALLVFLFLFAKDSQPEANEYGPCPK